MAVLIPCLALAMLLSFVAQEAPGAEPDGLAARATGRIAASRKAPPDSLSMVRLQQELIATSDSLAAVGGDSLAALALESAGQLAIRLGRVPESRELWTRGVSLARRHGHPALVATLLNSLATGYGRGGEYETSIELLTEVIRLRRSAGDMRREGVALGNLANAYALLGRIPEALATTDSALARDRISGNALGLAAGFNRLSGLMRDLNRPLEALAWSDSALATCRARSLREPLANFLQRRVSILTNAGREDEAMVAAFGAVAAAESTGNALDLVFAHISRAELLHRMGRPAECLALIDSLQARVDSFGDEDLSLQLLIPECAARLDLRQHAEAEARLRPAIEALERRRDRQGSEASQLGVMHNLGELYAALARSQVEQGRMAEGWSAVERGRAPLLRDRLDPGGAAITLEGLQGRLRETNAVLVQFNDPTISPLGAFVVTPDSCRFVALSDAEALAVDAAAAVTRMAGGASDAELAPLLERLSAGLLQPVLPFLPAGSRHLFWIAPASLAAFPVEALRFPSAGAGVGRPDEPPSISYLPAASALHFLEGRSPGTEVIVVADPELTVPEGSGLLATTVRALAATPLPYARREARAIAPPASRIHLGRNAARSAVAGPATHDAAVLHFATHALINATRPERSALLLAGPDGLLTAADVESLELHADLVVLSGCRTGGGLTTLGEGTLGLARSFLAAGSRSVVMSLWDVEDRAASRFMEHFYEGLRLGSSRAAALEGARRRLRDEGFPSRDWAPFVLAGIGDRPVAAIAGTPAPASSTRPAVAAGIGALLLAAAGLFLLARKNAGRTGDYPRQ